MKRAHQVMQPMPTEENLKPFLATLAAASVVLTLYAALDFFVIIPSQPSRSDLAGLAYLGPFYIACFSGLLCVVAALWTLGAIGISGDRRAAWTFGLFLLAPLFAFYAVYQGENEHPGHVWLSAVYGFPIEHLSSHPVALYGSLGLIAAIAPIAFAYALTRGQTRRISAAAGLPVTLAIWIAIRIAG